jgi:hypothetical protein
MPATGAGMMQRLQWFDHIENEPTAIEENIATA